MSINAGKLDVIILPSLPVYNLLEINLLPPGTVSLPPVTAMLPCIAPVTVPDLLGLWR